MLIYIDATHGLISMVQYDLFNIRVSISVCRMCFAPTLSLYIVKVLYMDDCFT